MVHIWGVLGSISGPHCRVNKWSTSSRSIKIVASEDFSEPRFQRGVQSFRCFLVFWSKNRLSKREWQTLPFAIFCSGGCCCVLLLDYKKGGGKNYKTRFFATPFLREGKGRKEERCQRSKTPPFLHQKVWALQRGRRLFHPLGPKISIFQIC